MIDIKDEKANGNDQTAVMLTLEDDDNLLESPDGAKKYEIESPFLLANRKGKPLQDGATPEQLALVLVANLSRDDENLLIGTAIEKSSNFLELS